MPAHSSNIYEPLPTPRKPLFCAVFFGESFFGDVPHPLLHKIIETSHVCKLTFAHCFFFRFRIVPRFVWGQIRQIRRVGECFEARWHFLDGMVVLIPPSDRASSSCNIIVSAPFLLISALRPG